MLEDLIDFGQFAHDVIYLQVLVCSCVLAWVSRVCLARGRAREWFAGAAGVALVATVCGTHLLYSLGCAAVNLLLLVVVAKRRLPLVSFVVTFSYLLFFRCSHLVNLPYPFAHANAVQLLLTLRCIGLAFEIADSESGSKLTRPIRAPTLLQAFCYYYNFAGLFTAPYYTYRVHSDMVYAKNLKQLSVSQEIVPRLVITPFFIGVMLVLTKYFPLAYMHTDEFYETYGFAGRLLYMAPVFLYLRLRVYSAWMLAECCCVANGIGAYPAELKPVVGAGPKHSPMDAAAAADVSGSGEIEFTPEMSVSFETVRNIDPYAAEFSPGVRSGMRSWNRSVQYWLATFVYRRSGRAYRLPLTMLVSAFWHGVHAGYYLSFLTVPLCTAAEDAAESWWRGRRLPTLAWWFFRMRAFEYMAMGFLLLSWRSTVRYWQSIYFAVHVVAVAVLLVSFVLKAARKFTARPPAKKNE